MTFRKTLKIGFIAGPGSGKSTAAADVFVKCKHKQIPVYYVQEFAREEIDSGWEMESVAEQFRILKEQRRREDIIPEEIKVMITDSPTLLVFFYAMWHSNDTIKDAAILTSLYEEFLLDSKRYDYLILLNRVKPYTKESTRAQSEKESDMITMQQRVFMDLHKIPYIVMDGNEESVSEIMKIIYSEVI